MPPLNIEKQTKIVNRICCYVSILSNATNFDENVEEKKKGEDRLAVKLLEKNKWEGRMMK